MFGLKRKGREQSAKMHRLISDSIYPWIETLSTKIRYRARKRILNRWGRHHPRRVVGMYGIFVVVILSVNIMSFLTSNSQPSSGADPFRLASKSAVNPMAGMTEITVNRERINAVVSDYAAASVNLANRLDSLCNLEVKTRRDSIEIMNLYNILINKTDNNNEPQTN